MGELYSRQGDREKAMIQYKQYLSLKEELGDLRGMSIALAKIGSAFSHEKKYADALMYLDKAISIGRRLDLKFYLCWYLHTKAEIHYVLKDYEMAVLANDEALHIPEGYPDALFNSAILKCKLIALSDPENAVVDLERILVEADSNHKKARLHYELFQLEVKKLESGVEKDPKQLQTLNSRLQTHQRAALELYKKLWAKTPDVEYKDRIDELERKNEDLTNK